jgi:hypothetical protein
MPWAKQLRALVLLLPTPLSDGLRTLADRLPIVGDLRRRYNAGLVDVFIISFPKCGRTWLRLMLSKACQLHFGIDIDVQVLDFRYLYNQYSQIPKIAINHDDNPHYKHPDEIVTDKSFYRGKNVIFLVRDPRDVLVSLYFEHTKRRGFLYGKGKAYQGDMSSFIQRRQGSLSSLIRFYNVWAANRHVPAKFMLLRYEDLHVDPSEQFRRILEFINLPQISGQVVAEVVELTRFENVQRMERQDASRLGILKPGDKADPESYKARRGIVGGYVDYLSKEDIDYINQQLKDHLDPYYGYHRPSVILSERSE